ncbi:MAG: carboxypeptidase-like regulatory domain-containing protein [Bacteroidetes bacterium]|nr:carboxypeptidase-like regulatory domain-containing protein [Bacteroidota bacterium]
MISIKKLVLATIFLILTGFSEMKAQKKTIDEKLLIQFSGAVVSADSLQPIPFTSVIIRNARRGTITDYYGFFSFVAMKGDTIDFQYIGYKSATYILPDTLDDKYYSIIQLLSRDTINLREATVYPWPSRDEFKRAFLELKLPGDDLKRAQRNFELASMKEIQDQVPFDGSINYKMALQQRQTQLYTAGQYPSITLLNPLAWASFIQAWKDGAFKKKDAKKP